MPVRLRRRRRFIGRLPICPGGGGPGSITCREGRRCRVRQRPPLNRQRGSGGVDTIHHLNGGDGQRSGTRTDVADAIILGQKPSPAPGAFGVGGSDIWRWLTARVLGAANTAPGRRTVGLIETVTT